MGSPVDAGRGRPDAARCRVIDMPSRHGVNLDTMRYYLPVLWFCISCVTSSLPPARVAQAAEGSGGLRAPVRGPEHAPMASPADVNALMTLRQDYLHTALALYHAAAAKPGNVVVAPHSTATALAMLYSGARGESAAQLSRALGWRLPPEQLDAAHEALQSVMMQRATTDTNTVISLASRLWLAADLGLADGYQDLTARCFGASAGVVDFARDPSAARAAINAWVAEQTHQLIPDLLGPSSVDRATQLVQTSAMYFKANWLFPFDVAGAPATFHAADGSTPEVTMLEGRLGSKYRYAETASYQAVEIHYEGAALAMDIVVPKGELAEVTEHWDAAAMQDLAASFAGRDVVLHLPKFDFESSLDVTAALRGLGVHDLFDPRRADLSSMLHGRNVAVGSAVSKAKITVDEHGTEAAAATAIVLTPASAEPGEPVELTVNKPFLFVVRDVAQNLVLLMGRVDKP